MINTQADVLRVPQGRHSAGDGLYLQVTPKGRSWLYRFTLAGRAREMGLGSAVGPTAITLKQARDLAIDARRLAASGVDPIEQRKVARAAAAAPTPKVARTFREAATEYIAIHEVEWKGSENSTQWTQSLTRHAFPVIGDKGVDVIDKHDVLDVLHPIWLTTNETARRVRQRIESILDAAIAKDERTDANPAVWGVLYHLLANIKRKVKHHPALPYVEIPAFMADLRERTNMAARALEFTILTAVRTNETIGALKSEISFDNACWTIPAERMKKEREHIVPLCDRALHIAETEMASASEYLFAGLRGGPLSGNTMLDFLHNTLGRADLTVHGFRSSFRTWAEDTTDAVHAVLEKSLAHAIPDATEKAYARGELFAKRRVLMSAWGDYCGGGRGKVLPLRAVG